MRYISCSIFLSCAYFVQSVFPSSAVYAQSTDKESTTESQTSISEDLYRTLVNKDRTKIEMRNDVTVALLKVRNSNYGAGSIDFVNGSVRRDNPSWQEWTAIPKIRVTQGLENGSSLYMRLSAAAGYTTGDGDAASLSTTSDSPFLLDSEDAVIGWKSGKLFKTEDVIDISVGNQSICIADAFVISSGTADAYRRSAFFLGPRNAYRQTALVKINTQPVRGQLFHIRTNTNQKRMNGEDQPKTFMYGGNIEYAHYNKKNEEKWHVGMMALYAYRSDRKFEGTSMNRQGMQLYNPHMGGNFLPFAPDFRFHAGLVHQKNNNTDRKIDANAYYVEPGYQFSKIMMQPLLTYRYMHFSGDAGTKNIKKSYDPMQFGYWARDGYGTWEVGQIHGTFYFTNTNQNVHNVHLRFTPYTNHTVGIQYYHIRFHRPAQAGSISSRAGDEWDIYWDWHPYTWLSLNVMAGVNIPKRGVCELIRDGNPTVDPLRIGKSVYFGQVSATFTF